MKHKLIITFFTIFFLPYIVFAQNDSTELSLSVTEAMEYALQNNTNVQNAQLDVIIADKKVWETTTIGLPQVSASGSYNNNLSLATQLIPAEVFGGEPGEFAEVQFGTKHNFNGTLTVSQLIFSGSYIVGLQAAKVYRSLSEKSLNKTEIDTKSDVASTYYTILMAEETFNTLTSNYNYIQDLYKQTQKMAEAGLIDNIEADKLRVTLGSLDNSVKSMKRQIEVLYSLFKIQIGADKDANVELTDNLNDILLNIEIDALLKKEFVLEEHADYQLTKVQEELMALDLKRYKSEYLPTLSAFYNFQENAMRDKFNPLDSDEKWFESSMLGFQLDIPIFNSGQKRSKVQQARLELEKATNTKEFVGSSLYSSLLQARSDFITNQEIMINTKENMEVSKKVLDEVSIKHKEGMASSFELNQANSDYLTTVSEYTQAVVNLLNAKIELEKILNEL